MEEIWNQEDVVQGEPGYENHFILIKNQEGVVVASTDVAEIADRICKIPKLEAIAEAFNEKHLGADPRGGGRLEWLRIFFNCANKNDGISEAWEADADATAMMFSEVAQFLEEASRALELYKKEKGETQ